MGRRRSLTPGRLRNCRRSYSIALLNKTHRATGFQTSKQAFLKRHCDGTPIGKSRRQPPGASARPNKVARQDWNALHSVNWKAFCARIKSKVWGGCIFCGKTDSAEF